MSIFGFLPGRVIILGFSSFRSWKLKMAACLSEGFVAGLSFILPSSFRTSWGISHSIGLDVVWFARSWIESFCFVVVRMKFVSSRICMG